MTKKIRLHVPALVEMYKSGSSAKEIAQVFGVHESTIERRLRAAGVRLGRKLDVDVDLLVKLYEDGESTVSLARRFGTDPSVIGQRLKRAGVVLRPGGRFRSGMAREKYTDREWLESQYWGKKRSQVEIGEECGVSPALISQKMRRFGIPTRSQSESKILKAEKHVPLEQELLSILEGELLGDGSLVVAHSGKSAAYQHGCMHKDYVLWLRGLLEKHSLGCSQTIYVSKSDSFGTGTLQTSYHFKSLYYPELLALRKRFYPDGEKIVPEDLALNPTSLLHWYLGDGSLDSRRPSITLCSDAFDALSLRHLRAQLIMLGIRTSLISSRGVKSRVYIGVGHARKFLSLIGSCPDEIRGIFGYKWLID